MTSHRGVRLDRPTRGDIHAIYSDPRVWKHLPSGRFSDLSQTERMVNGWIGGWTRDHLSSWVLRDEETGDVIGNAGCSLRRNTFWNLGYRLTPEAQGRGHAAWASREAVDAAQLATVMEH